LEKLHEQVENYQKMQKERKAEALRIEQERRTMVKEEITREVT
jgi:hypothetical protein